jgi:pyruvate dehydrogenase E1 component alpha subunit
MSRVWRGFDIPVEEFDGNDPEVVYETVARAVARARGGEGPSVLEGLTYRLHPHIWYDKATYQPNPEIAEWWRRDPLRIARGQLVRRGVSDHQLSTIATTVAEEIESTFAAVDRAPDATWADSFEVTAK